MLKIGLTGSIAMGKSYVAKQLARLGIVVSDADNMVNNAFFSNKKLHDKLSKIFPECFNEGIFNKQVLSKIVFNDKKKLNILEKIIHPLIAKERNNFIRKNCYKRVRAIVFDIPLLLEKKIHKQFDYVMLASSPKYLQVKRALNRSNMNTEKLNLILKKQMKDHKKRAKSDVIIHTGSNKAHSFREIKAFINKILCVK
jgi:dephospho-CoA kinase